jgi:acyl carrier protein
MSLNASEIDPLVHQLKRFIIGRYAAEFTVRGVDLNRVPDTLDLLTEGIIDSLGLMELISALGEAVGFEIDFDGLDADHLTVVGPLTQYVAGAVAQNRRLHPDSATDAAPLEANRV